MGRGPQRTHYYPNMPFWRLKSDGFWQLINTENCINLEKPSKEPTSKQLDFDLTEFNRQRDLKFRQLVLRAYNYQCAICGFDLRHDSIAIGLEAAHVKWKQHGGPCIVNNGLALCSLHHSAFDMGSIELDSSFKIKISSGVNGHQMVEKLFWVFEGKNILLPRVKEDYVHDRFIEWHLQEVFRQ
nr:HNH endonuclease [Gilliamella apicola]